MKKLLLTIMIAACTVATYAQVTVQDQNPNYKLSMDKYVAAQPSLQATMNTTVQSTYEAYDWSTAKAERQKDRRDFRRQRQLFNMYNGYNDGYYNDYNYGNRYNNGYNNYGYNNGYNNNYYNYNRRYQNSNRCFFWFW